MMFFILQPFLNKFLKCHDTCGVHNLHGMPAILAAIAGAVTASYAEAAVYSYEGQAFLLGMHSFIHSFNHSSIYSFIHSLVHPSIHPSINQ